MTEHKQFWDWFVKFIAHFSRVYDNGAPLHAKADSAWSADASNVDEYLRTLRMI
jgi:hypothetical protein